MPSSVTAATLLLAHQGGWDEVLLILTPIAIFAALLGLANRRANAEVSQRGEHGPTGAAGAAGEEPPGDGRPAPATDDGETDPEDDGPLPPPGGAPATQ